MLLFGEKWVGGWVGRRRLLCCQLMEAPSRPLTPMLTGVRQCMQHLLLRASSHTLRLASNLTAQLTGHPGARWGVEV